MFIYQNYTISLTSSSFSFTGYSLKTRLWLCERRFWNIASKKSTKQCENLPTCQKRNDSWTISQQEGNQVDKSPSRDFEFNFPPPKKHKIDSQGIQQRSLLASLRSQPSLCVEVNNQLVDASYLAWVQTHQQPLPSPLPGLPKANNGSCPGPVVRKSSTLFGMAVWWEQPDSTNKMNFHL